MTPLKKLVYGESDLTLKEQCEIADDLLDVYISQLNDMLPDVDLWMSGSVLYNRLSVGCGEEVKMQLLSKKKILENAEKCSDCGREYTDGVKRWTYDSFLVAGKKALEKVKSNG